MIRSLKIENYKSIESTEIELGRTNVFIGANGSGKSNILEAITMCSAAAVNQLSNGDLVKRGVRVTSDANLMRSAFSKQATTKDIRISITSLNGISFSCNLRRSNDDPYEQWTNDSVLATKYTEDLRMWLESVIKDHLQESASTAIESGILDRMLAVRRKPLSVDDFVIFSPEISFLRTFEKEGQIEPLGRRGEGLYKLLRSYYSRANLKRLAEVKKALSMFDWFADFEVPVESSLGDDRLQLRDKFLDEKLAWVDQMSSNEGFLFVLFYLCLYSSQRTPNFFAVDNIDLALNPKLCQHLIAVLHRFAARYKKQSIVTTHNPALIDGLNLTNDGQRLFVVRRNANGRTIVERIQKPKPLKGQRSPKMSELFLNGLIGGLPKNF
jgi:AAA15 family ATPase/GTPase